MTRDARNPTSSRSSPAHNVATPHSVAAALTAASSIPTIGIGSGHGTCHGEVNVFHDLVGGFPWFIPGFVQPKANISADITRAVTEWRNELKTPAE